MNITQEGEEQAKIKKHLDLQSFLNDSEISLNVKIETLKEMYKELPDFTKLIETIKTNKK